MLEQQLTATEVSRRVQTLNKLHAYPW